MPTSTERIRSHQGYFGRDRAHRQGRAHRGHRRGQGLRCGAYISAFPRAGKLLRESWGRIPQLAPCDFHGQLRKRRPHCVAVLLAHDPKSRPRSQQPCFTEGSACEMDSEASVSRSAGVRQTERRSSLTGFTRRADMPATTVGIATCCGWPAATADRQRRVSSPAGFTQQKLRRRPISRPRQSFTKQGYRPNCTCPGR